jgi:TetR/AcrR family transcriptional regulator, multidrug resistance operon repressor
MNIHLYIYTMRRRNIDKEKLVKNKAIETMGKYGLEGFSMGKLAKACNISVATLYIYFKDKDDLIINIAIEEGAKAAEAMLHNFDPESPFETGLRIQWKNRYNHAMNNLAVALFFDQLRSSSYHDRFMGEVMSKFKKQVSAFVHNAIKRGELNAMPVDVFWSVAYAPLYSLIRFHQEGRSITGQPFEMTEELLWATFDLVIKALKN